MRKPDLIIGPRHDPQTIRWHIFRWRGWQLSLHKWLRSDSDRAPHDHKADNLSIILNAGYWETVRIWDTPYPFAKTSASRWDATRKTYYRDITRFRWPLVPYFRKAETLHRVSLPAGTVVYTLWLRWPARRNWGYWCDNRGWVPQEEYNRAADYYGGGVSEVGQGCG